jgi:mono/diheme cytochrome c family protein
MVEQGAGKVGTRSWIVLALVVLTGAGCTPMDDVMVAIFGRSMRDQSSIGTYQDPRLPAEGSVPFASGNFPASAGEYGMNQAEGTAIPAPITGFMVTMATEDPGAVPEISGLVNPVPADAASLMRGEEVYNRACVPCHGQDGGGQGLVAAPGVGMPAFSVISDQARGYSDGFLYSIVRAGRGLMPAYGHQIAHYDRWHVVNYLRQLQGAQPVQAGEAPSPDSEDQGDEPDA